MCAATAPAALPKRAIAVQETAVSVVVVPLIPQPAVINLRANHVYVRLIRSAAIRRGTRCVSPARKPTAAAKFVLAGQRYMPRQAVVSVVPPAVVGADARIVFVHWIPSVVTPRGIVFVYRNVTTTVDLSVITATVVLPNRTPGVEFLVAPIACAPPTHFVVTSAGTRCAQAGPTTNVFPVVVRVTPAATVSAVREKTVVTAAAIAAECVFLAFVFSGRPLSLVYGRSTRSSSFPILHVSQDS